MSAAEYPEVRPLAYLPPHIAEQLRAALSAGHEAHDAQRKRADRYRR